MAAERVTISELREWATMIFDTVEARGVASVDLQSRYYWTLHSEQIWDVDPPTATLGDLADDLSDIRSDLGDACDDADRALFAWHTLDHFRGVLGKLSADIKGYDFGTEDQQT